MTKKFERCSICDTDERKKSGYLCSFQTSDGLPVRCCHQETFKKLQVLRYYLEIFSVAMKNHFATLNFIDLFAGPGLCRERDYGEEMPGSSLLALELAHPFSKYVFVDADPVTSGILRDRCAKHRPHLADRVTICNVDANSDIDSVLNKVEKTNSLSVVLLDPNGLDIHFSTLATLAEYKHVDLIINFAVSDLKRNRGLYSLDESITKGDLFFGGKDWRSKTNHLELLSYYKDRIREIGFTCVENVVEGSVTVKTRTGAPIYYLLFASKHERGLDFWQKAKKSFGNQASRDLFS